MTPGGQNSACNVFVAEGDVPPFPFKWTCGISKNILIACKKPVIDEILWPCDVLAGILHFLALDGASKTFCHLAYMTNNNTDLRSAAKRIPQPLVLRVGFDRDSEDKTFIFIFPFQFSVFWIVHYVA
jgi:hypothetical protein